MKSKWKISYWCNDTDKPKVVFCVSFEQAMTKFYKLKAKGHSNVQVKLNGGQP